MNTELSAIMTQDGRLVEWSNKIKYNVDMNAEDKEISAVLDNWAKNVGKTGLDANHEISQMITKAITPETVAAPSVLIERMFNTGGNIGEFDDTRIEKAPKNTIKVYESMKGGNVDRSFIDFSVLAPKWVELQAETDLSLQDMRRGGYKTVATLVNFITEAMEYKKIAAILNVVDTAIVNGAANYINETTAMPTETSMKALSLYLHDTTDGETPMAFGLNKYKQAIAGLTGATTYLTDAVKNQYNTTGFISQYAGMDLIGLSGQKKLPDGSFIVPNQRIFGCSGVIGDVITRGETLTLQNTDINSEKIHIKVNGYSFGIAITDLSKVAKVVLA